MLCNVEIVALRNWENLPASNMEETTVLYRPVGPSELQLIADTGYRAFPPRLPEQPIFYPVSNQEYATQIARDWNANDPRQKAGFVTRFRVRTAFLSRHELRTVGTGIHQEYWVPAGDLGEFNLNIVGPIEVIAEFRMDARPDASGRD